MPAAGDPPIYAPCRIVLRYAASEAFFSTLEHEVLSRHRFATKAQARAVVTRWCHDFYNLRRRHSTAGLLPPVEYEKIAAIQPEAA